MGALRNRLGLDRFDRPDRGARITPPTPRYGYADQLSNTGGPHLRYMAPPFPAQNFNAKVTLERWFQQIQGERGHMHVQLHRMATEEPAMTRVYLRMRDLGYEVRGDAMTAINRDFGMQHAADPHHANVYFSNRRLLYKVCERHGIAVADMGPAERLAAMQYGDGNTAVYAYLQTFETEQPPVLVIDRDPYNIGVYHAQSDTKSIRLWSWYAACCLAKYLYDEPMYRGDGAIVEAIAPFDPRRYAAFFPLAHSFVKGLLHIDPPLCPEQWTCGCNRIESLFVRRPQDHPWPTGELPGDVVRQHVAQQQLQEDYGQYGQAAPPSRGMTPPGGTRHGDIVREYNRQHRGDTDPNLGRGGK